MYRIVLLLISQFVISRNKHSFLCSFCQTVLEVCYLIPQTNIGTLVVSIVAIIGLILAKELNAYLGKKIPIPIPVELLAVSIIHTVYALPSKDKHSCAPALTHPQIHVLLSVSSDCCCDNNLLAS